MPLINKAARTTRSGLVFQDVRLGKGRSPQKGDIVTCRYTLWRVGIDAARRPLQTCRTGFTFALRERKAIKGFLEGIPGMRVGGVRTMSIPPHLAYGAKGAGDGIIPPDTTLMFRVELIGVRG